MLEHVDRGGVVGSAASGHGVEERCGESAGSGDGEREVSGRARRQRWTQRLVTEGRSRRRVRAPLPP